MKTIAAIQVDLETTSLGTASRLAEKIGGTPVLRRTIERVSRVKQIDAIHLLCPASQTDACKHLIQGMQGIVQPFESPPPTWAPLVQSARKWSIDGWRGGLGGTTYFDEFTDPRLLEALLQSLQVDRVLSVPAAAVLFDPNLADRMLEHDQSKSDDSKLTFTQAPPGLAGIVLDKTIIQELAQANVPIGWVLSYKPDNPRKDLIFEPCLYEVSADLRFSAGRLVADTDRSVQRLEDLLAQHPDPDEATVGRWLHRRQAEFVEPVPRELEIELTTGDPFPDCVLRPRGATIEPRGPMTTDLAGRIVSEIRRFDDSLLILAGFGDPLRHPDLAGILAAIRSNNNGKHPLFGLAIRTTGVDLSDDVIETILDHEVDILEVSLDAWTQDTYAKVQSPNNAPAGDLALVLKNLDRLSELRPRDKTVKPIIVPEMTKARQNVHELDAFHDGWLRKLGAVAITGYSHRARRRPDYSVIQMAPSPRTPCRRLGSRCVVLADGRVTLCDQDINGDSTVGQLSDSSLEAIWLNRDFDRVRQAQRQERFDVTATCATCEDWHRP